jgi:hypothetical protein
LCAARTPSLKGPAPDAKKASAALCLCVTIKKGIQRQSNVFFLIKVWLERGQMQLRHLPLYAGYKMIILLGVVCAAHAQLAHKEVHKEGDFYSVLFDLSKITLAQIRENAPAIAARAVSCLLSETRLETCSLCTEAHAVCEIY